MTVFILFILLHNLLCKQEVNNQKCKSVLPDVKLMFLADYRLVSPLVSLANIPLTPESARDQERRIRREIANSNERRRMQSINAGFQSLKTLIPHSDGEKLSKVTIHFVLNTSPERKWKTTFTLLCFFSDMMILCFFNMLHYCSFAFAYFCFLLKCPN